MVTRRNVDMKQTRQSHKQTPVATGSILKMYGARTLLLRSKAKTIAQRSLMHKVTKEAATVAAATVLQIVAAVKATRSSLRPEHQRQSKAIKEVIMRSCFLIHISLPFSTAVRRALFNLLNRG
jgi:hypothetical protein